jgi:hypothetical protein
VEETNGLILPRTASLTPAGLPSGHLSGKGVKGFYKRLKTMYLRLTKSSETGIPFALPSRTDFPIYGGLSHGPEAFAR